LGSLVAYTIGTMNPGSATYDKAKDLINVRAAGADIWDANDQQTFVGTAVSGDFTITAEIPKPPAYEDSSITRGDGKIGLEMRTGLENDAPYALVFASVMRDPETGAYNIAFLRNMYKGPRRLGLHMSPRHNWQIVREHETRDQPTPVAIVVSHHPAFYIGALNVSAFGIDDYAVVGGMFERPLRLVPSTTWGEDLLIPADADLVLEGHVLPNAREVEGPFGEFPGTYGPQRVRWVVEITALNRRSDAIYQDVFVGHPDNWVLGSFPKEGSIFNAIKGVVPTVKAVHLPTSAVGRFHCYISIDKRVDGESKQAALIALGACDFVKHVVVVDSDIDVYREEEVLWAIATRVQADQDVDIIKNVKGATLDPSQIDDIMGAKMIIDATRPVRRPFESRIEIPADAMERVRLERLIPEDQLRRLD